MVLNAEVPQVLFRLSRWEHLEQATGQSIKRLVRTLKKYRSFELNVAGTTLHAATPLPRDVQNLVDAIINP